VEEIAQKVHFLEKVFCHCERSEAISVVEIASVALLPRNDMAIVDFLRDLVEGSDDLDFPEIQIFSVNFFKQLIL